MENKWILAASAIILFFVFSTIGNGKAETVSKTVTPRDTAGMGSLIAWGIVLFGLCAALIAAMWYLDI